MAIVRALITWFLFASLASGCGDDGCGDGEIVDLSLRSNGGCLVLREGAACCWGGNGSGGLGLGDPGRSSDRAVRVPGLAGVRTVASGLDGHCALLADGTVRCWGPNNLGQIGDGSLTIRFAPTAVADLRDVAQLVGNGDAGYCALLGDGTVRCWGLLRSSLWPSNDFDALPRARSDGADLVELSAAGGFVGRRADGRVTGREFLLDVGLRDVASLATGAGHHGCALLRDGTVRCWGANLFGELGDGRHDVSADSVADPGLTGVLAVAVGQTHTCAIVRDRTVRCWGRNESGQVGGGAERCTVAGVWTEPCRTRPTAVPGLTDVRLLALGYDTSCAVRGDGSLWCWGSLFGMPGRRFGAQPAPVEIDWR